MQKDFDLWNDRKKATHEKRKNAFYHEREIWWCILGTNIGYEQDGTGVGHERPVLVIRAFSKYVCLIVPLTTSKKENPYHMRAGTILDQKNFAVISQVRLIDTKRLVEKIDYMDKETFGFIRKAIKGML